MAASGVFLSLLTQWAGAASDGCMKNEGVLYVAAAVLSVGWLMTPGMTHAARDRGLNLNIDGNAESCAELKVRSTGETAQVNEAFTLSKGRSADPGVECRRARTDPGAGMGPGRLFRGNLQGWGGGDTRRGGTGGAGDFGGAFGRTNLIHRTRHGFG